MYQQRFKSYEECFWEKVRKSGENSCWNWTGAVRRGNRGNFRGRQASHVALELNGVTVPKGMYVCHHCDNPICVNPKHLFVGTQLDNVRDMIAKGRMNVLGAASGEKHPMARLASDQVTTIREKRKAGEAIKELAKEFGVSKSQIYRIVQGERWTNS